MEIVEGDLVISFRNRRQRGIDVGKATCPLKRSQSPFSATR